MAEEVAALSIRLEAQTARFNREMERATRIFTRATDQLERRADNVNARLNNFGSRFPQAAKRMEKSAKDSADAFQELFRLERGFEQLENSIDPATAAMRRFQQQQELVSRAVEAGVVDQTRAAAVLRTLENQYQLTNRSAGRAGGAYKNVGMIAQQAGFQVGDFAVQVAGGQNAMVAFSQQGSQLLGFFGPFGAALGAVVAIVGALAIAFWDTTTNAERLENALDDLSDASANLDRINGDLETASGDVKDALLAERDAALALAEAKITAGEAAVAAIRAEVEARAAANLSGEFRRRELAAGTVNEFTGFLESDPQAQIRAGMGDELAAQESQILKEDLETAKNLTRALTELAALRDRIRGGDGLGGGVEGARGREKTRKGRTPREKEDRFQEIAADTEVTIDAIRREIAVLGENEAARKTLANQLAAEELQRRLLEAAQSDGSEVTEEEREKIDQLVNSFFALKEAQDAATDAAERYKEQQEQVKDDIEKLEDTASSALTGLIDGTLKWNDALLAVLSTILEIARQNLLDMNSGGGGGLLGSIIGGVVSGIAGGVSGGGGFGTTDAFGIGAPFAKGAAFSGGRVTAFANGGVVSGATLFPMKDGAGLMGEAGPEAIMPLTRGPGGKLGVRAEGASKQITVAMTVVTRDANSFRRSEAQIRASAARAIGAADNRNN